MLSLLLWVSLLIPGAWGRAQGNRQELDRVLKGMAAVGVNFKSFKAGFTQKKYIAILEEFDSPESGVFIYARASDGSALLRQEVRKPADRILTIKDGVATIYQPLIKQATIVNLGQNKDKAEYLALGLGQSPARLEQTFDIEYLGTEDVDGAPCSILKLVPKSTKAAAYFSSITLWIKKAGSLPIQQKLQEPNGDYLLVKFTDERLNIKIPPSEFEQKLPKGVEIQRIQ